MDRCKECSGEIKALIASQGIGRFGISIDKPAQYKVLLGDQKLRLVVEVDTEEGWIIVVSDPPRRCSTCHGGPALEIKNLPVRVVEIFA